MAYKNLKTGQDESPEIKKHNIKVAVKVGNEVLAGEISNGNNNVSDLLQPVHTLATLLEDVSDAELHSKFVSQKIQEIGEEEGYTQYTSGLFGAERFATEKMIAKYGADRLVVLGDQLKRGKWGLYIKGQDAFNYYNKWLKYFVERILGRPLEVA